MKLFPQIKKIDARNASTRNENSGTEFRYLSAGCSDAGPCRKTNEDRYLDTGRRGVWAVADGMGGHRDGGLAAQSTLDAVAAAAIEEADLEAALKKINAALYADGVVHGTTGATVAVLQIADGICRVLWAGDCRIYRIRNGALTQLTEDHSEVNNMIRAGVITMKEAMVHPLRNVVTRAVGARKNLELESKEFPLHAGDGFLLCTDGLVNTIAEDRILKNWNDCKALVQEAIDNKAQDNVTALAVQIIDAAVKKLGA